MAVLAWQMSIKSLENLLFRKCKFLLIKVEGTVNK